MIGIVALLVPLLTVASAILYGQRRARAANVEEWAIGGRQFGTLIFWFINAGEIYTTFAVLGISGFAWAYGAPALLAFTSVSLASCIAYWLMPKIWAAGRDRKLVTQADFFADRFGSRWLTLLVALAGLFAIIVYVQVQITALSLVLQLTIGSGISAATSAVAAAIIMLAFVYLAGLRSAAFAAGVKDVLMIILVVLLSATVASRVGAGSLLDVFRLANARHPGIDSFPGLQPGAGLDTVWFMTSAINVALGTWMFPHMFQLCYAAHDETAIRRNAVWQPLYSLSYLFIIGLGFAALLAGTAPPAGDPNAALLSFVSNHYPAWMIGLLAGTCSLLALVPGSVLLLTGGTILARNVVQPLRPSLGPKSVLLISRLSMIGLAAISVFLTIGASDSIVKIGLSAYASISMLAPGVFLAFLWRRTTAAGVGLGLAAGYFALLHPVALAWWAQILPHWEPGLCAMLVNLAVAILASLATRQPRSLAEPAHA